MEKKNSFNLFNNKRVFYSFSLRVSCMPKFFHPWIYHHNTSINYGKRLQKKKEHRDYSLCYIMRVKSWHRNYEREKKKRNFSMESTKNLQEEQQKRRQHEKNGVSNINSSCIQARSSPSYSLSLFLFFCHSNQFFFALEFLTKFQCLQALKLIQLIHMLISSHNGFSLFFQFRFLYKQKCDPLVCSFFYLFSINDNRVRRGRKFM